MANRVLELYNSTISGLATILPFKAPSEERAFFDHETEQHVSQTGWAESSWTYHHAPNKLHPYPLLIVNGHSGVEAVYGPIAEEAARQGIDTITMEPPRWQRLDHAIHPEHMLHPERLLAQMSHRIVKDACKIYDFEKVDGAGHSMGGPGIVNAACHHPELFNSITLWGSAGITPHNIFTLGTSLPQVGVEVFKATPVLFKNFGIQALASVIKYGFTNPIRTIGESIAVSCSDLTPQIRQLHNLGIPVTGILFEDDGFFSPEDLHSEVREHIIKVVVLAGIGHIGPITDPEKVMKAQIESRPVQQLAQAS